VTQTDTYTAGGVPKSRPETGPTLYSVLAAVDPNFKSASKSNLRDYIELTSSEDGSSVLVSWAEIDPAANDKQILLSLNEEGHTILQQDTGPRLTVPGDTSGARYDYGVQVVTVFRSPTNL
jgi:hypothetical protein